MVNDGVSDSKGQGFVLQLNILIDYSVVHVASYCLDQLTYLILLTLGQISILFDGTLKEETQDVIIGHSPFPRVVSRV